MPEVCFTLARTRSSNRISKGRAPQASNRQSHQQKGSKSSGHHAAQRRICCLLHGPRPESKNACTGTTNSGNNAGEPLERTPIAMPRKKTGGAHFFALER